MDMRVLVGQNVVRLRKRLGLTQEQLAEKSGFSQQYLSDLERGRRNPTIVSLYELAQALGASHMDLLRPPRQKRVMLRDAGARVKAGQATRKPRRASG
jgi:transcriptional regulator with XRE-family HTH domain